MNRSLRLSVFLLGSSFAFSCMTDNSTPTQPIGVTPTAPPAATATVTAAAGSTPTATRPGTTSTSTPTAVATATPTAAATAHVVNVGPAGSFSFVDAATGTSTTTIRVGESVQWVWRSSPHSTTSGNCCTPNGIWDSGIQNSGTFTRNFSSTGSFPYFCMVHGSAMTGTVVVNP